MNLRKTLHNLIKQRWASIPPDEKRVLIVIMHAFDDRERVTQQQIAEHHMVKVGKHEEHEAHLNPKRESTLRKVRQLIRNLRVNHGIPIISSRKGYTLPENQTELQEFVEELERRAKAQAAAWHETYRAIKNNLNVTSSFFDGMSAHLED